MRYLGVDPGETTGLVLLDTTDTFTHYHVNSLARLYSVLLNIQPDYIICEDFDRREKPGRIAPILKGIGVVQLYAEQYTVPVELQSASYGKGFWDNGKLKQAGAYKPSMKHANDAARHVLQYISFKESNFKWMNMITCEVSNG
jgi:hypothetical protein